MKAKKITFECFKFPNQPKIILAKIISEDIDFLEFISGKGKIYRIKKNLIQSIEDTNQEFIEVKP
jgi:hypothetical protein